VRRAAKSISQFPDAIAQAAALQKSYAAACARFSSEIAEPARGPRLIDPLLRLFGADSQSYAKRERAAAIERMAFDAVLAENPGVTPDDLRSALRSSSARSDGQA
jgi:hypothetical protein